MATLISNSGCDERGKINGGKAGDQTGYEWVIRNWYNRPWKCVLRHPDAKVRSKFAELSRAAANNNNVGYDQYQRDTYWNQLIKNNYNPSKITVPCEADCSAGVIANTKATGYILGNKNLQAITATYTGNMREAFKKAGFTCLTDKKYLTSGDYLIEGDILLNDSCHTAAVVSNGSKSGEDTVSNTKPVNNSSSKKIVATEAAREFNRNVAGTYYVKVASALNLRNGAGTAKNEYGSNKSVLTTLKNGTKVQNYGYYRTVNGVKWLFIQTTVNGVIYTGFVSSTYLVKK